MATEQEIVEAVLEEFKGIAAIPRPSGHEKAVSDYLYGRLQALGCKVMQDEVCNLIADLPATKGREKAPLTILQSHMDMVCVADEGVVYDPITDPIRLQRSEKYLAAEGTSLGSDDGIGIASILYVLAHSAAHGPLRAIFTVDEEVGMHGATFLAADYLTDASFLINCDSEDYDQVTVGSAGSVGIDFHRPLTFSSSPEGRGWKIAVKGLLGGHSGERIGDGRGNAIRTLALLLASFQEHQISFRLSGLQGGKARNAIPASAEAVIVSTADEQTFRAVLDEAQQRFLTAYGSVDPAMHIFLTEMPLPQQVFSPADMEAFWQLVTSLHTGVYAMEPAIPGLVETSANIGMAFVKDGVLTVTFYPRSTVDSKLREFQQTARILGRWSGFAVETGEPAPGWKERTESRLTPMMTRIFEEQNGKPMSVVTIHAGLECGWHIKKNPALDMVSIGVTTKDIHSPKERLVLATVAPQVRLMDETLHRIAAL